MICLNPVSLCCVCRNDAILAASDFLSDLGIPVVFTPDRSCTHLLLPVPSFSLGDSFLSTILDELPDHVIVSGGNLASEKLSRYQTIDFLTDPVYLAQNAAITARCAVMLVIDQLQSSFHNKKILILGFGRIGKCLCRELYSTGAEIYAAARKNADLALIGALGIHAVPISDIEEYAGHMDIIFNTVPQMVLTRYCPKEDSIAIELASKPGIGGQNVISARGLPAKMAPEESGELIARTFIRLSL